MGKYSLLSRKQVYGKEQLKIFDQSCDISAYAPPFYLLTGGESFEEKDLFKEKYNGIYMLKDYDIKERKVLIVDRYDDLSTRPLDSKTCGIRPIISFSKYKRIPTNNGLIHINNDCIAEVEYGYFPTIIADENISRQLRSSLGTISNKYYIKNLNGDWFSNMYIYYLDGRKYVHYLSEPSLGQFGLKDCFIELKPVIWYVDISTDKIIMVSKNILQADIPRLSVDKFLNSVFAKNLEQCIEKVHDVTLSEIKDKIFGAIEDRIFKFLKLHNIHCHINQNGKSNIDEKSSNSVSKRESEIRKSILNNDACKNISSCHNNNPQISNLKSLGTDEDIIIEQQSNNTFYIDIIFNNEIYTIPLDDFIIRKIIQQDDVSILDESKKSVIRNCNNQEETFKINNALRRAYINCLSYLSKELKDYLRKYDRQFKYSDIDAVTSMKTMVNELAYIYYREYTSQNNDRDITHSTINSFRLDKGFNEEYYKKIEKVYFKK